MVSRWKKWPAAGVAMAAVMLAACGGDSNSSPKADLRVIHAAGNAPAVNVKVNGAALDDAQGLRYGEATDSETVRANTYSVSVDARLPGGAVTEVVAPEDITLAPRTTTTVVAIGNVGDMGATAFGPTVIVSDNESVAPSNTRVQIVHASAAAETAVPAGVSVYVTAPGADLSEATPTTTFNLRGFTDPLTVPAGQYQIRITPAGSVTPVFDSGEITLPGGADLMVLALDSHGPGAPVKLLVSTGDDDDDFFIVDRNAPAEVRVVHAASGVGAAEVFASSESLSLPVTEVIDSFDYRESEPLADLDPAADYRFVVNADGGGAVGAPIDVSPVALAGARYYTALAAGNLADGITLLLDEDDRRSVATEARVRAIHAASLAGTVDVFINAAGSVTVNSIELGEVAPALDGFDYQDITGYLSLAAGSYDIRVGVPSDGGGYDVAIDLTGVALADGDIVSLVATNPATPGAEFEFIVLAD